VVVVVVLIWVYVVTKPLLLTTYETLLNKADTGIGKSLEEAVLYGPQEAMETPKKMH